MNRVKLPLDINFIGLIAGKEYEYTVPQFEEVNWDYENQPDNQIIVTLFHEKFNGRANLLYDSVKEFKEDFNII